MCLLPFWWWTVIQSSWRPTSGCWGGSAAGSSPLAAGGKALRCLSCERLGLIVVDVRLFDGDGLDVVRVACGTRTPPFVIIVTGGPRDGNGRRAFEAGATVYLTKPIGLHAFTVVLRELLRVFVADRR